MKCPECGFENKPRKKFCTECGSRLPSKCPDCNAEVEESERFCGECGHHLSLPVEPHPKDLSFEEKIAKIQRYLPEGLTEKILSQRDRIEGERKQVTVMFCDMEGFSALAERLGPEEAYSIMDEVYEILIHKVHDYEGTVNEMTGDGIVALFGAPIALEDAPQRAIRSAMAIHREMSRFSERVRAEKAGTPPVRMRIGIHSGPVVVGTLGNDLRVEFKAVGDTVNLASRVEELAKPGTTYVSGETFKLTEGLFRFEALGPKEIKGKAEPVNIYQVIAPSTRRTRFDVSAERGLTPFVGRERELEILLDGLAEAKSGRGQAFSVVAEAGVGKSRLLYEFRKAVANEDVTFLEGRSLSYSRGVVYHPVIDTLKSNFDIQEEDTAFQIVEKVKEGLRRLDISEAAILPYLLHLLSVEENGLERTPLSAETRKVRIIEALKTLVLRSAEIRPLLMAFEDLHWVDRSSEDVFRALLESIAGARVLLIFTYRPEFVHTWGGKSYHSQLNLNRLSNREALAMITHLLGTKEMEKDLTDLILQKAEGIPFFIEEFVKSLREQEIIEKKDNTYSLAKDIEEVAIPSTIQDVIMARIDSLPEGAKQTLQTGSVIDREFSLGLIERVMGVPEQELRSSLSILRDSELLYERGVYPLTTHVFKHALTQEVAYNSLTVKRKKETHERIGKALEEVHVGRLEEHFELLAYHYSRSENKPKAVEYLDLANQKAAKANAIEEARRYFDLAMGLLDQLPETPENLERRTSLLVNQWFVFQLLLRVREYHDLLDSHQSYVDRIADRGLVGSFYSRLAWCEWYAGNFQQSLRMLSEATPLCEADGNFAGAAFAYCMQAWCHLWLGNFETVLEMKGASVLNAQKQFELRTYVYALVAAQLAFVRLGRWDEALQEGQEALNAAERLEDTSLISFSLTFKSMAHTYKGELDQALHLVDLAVRKALTPADKYWAETIQAFAWYRVGEEDRGVEVLTRLLAMARAYRDLIGEVLVLEVIGEGLLSIGRDREARLASDELLDLAHRCGTKLYTALAERLLGEVDLKTNAELAASHFEKAISIFQEIKAENELGLAYSGMGRLHKQQRNTEQARECLTKALEIFERLGTLLEPDKVKQELAALPA